jgi:hypothetical protein
MVWFEHFANEVRITSAILQNFILESKIKIKKTDFKRASLGRRARELKQIKMSELKRPR